MQASHFSCGCVPEDPGNVAPRAALPPLGVCPLPLRRRTHRSGFHFLTPSHVDMSARRPPIILQASRLPLEVLGSRHAAAGSTSSRSRRSSHSPRRSHGGGRRYHSVKPIERALAKAREDDDVPIDPEVRPAASRRVAHCSPACTHMSVHCCIGARVCSALECRVFVC